ncbi:hypothetical protein EV426DRAFT_615254 [Tirmania nivea]|nr:hypothetical protein EV426DRAFT_615254 [Tirmania nivea]
MLTYQPLPLSFTFKIFVHPLFFFFKNIFSASCFVSSSFFFIYLFFFFFFFFLPFCTPNRFFMPEASRRLGDCQYTKATITGLELIAAPHRTAVDDRYVCLSFYIVA